jgi:hypothetical protein
MENEIKDQKNSTSNNDGKELEIKEPANVAEHYKQNPHLNKRNAVTIIMPNREKFIEVKTIIEEAKKEDPSFTEGKLFLDALAYCQSQGFYLVN